MPSKKRRTQGVLIHPKTALDGLNTGRVGEDSATPGMIAVGRNLNTQGVKASGNRRERATDSLPNALTTAKRLPQQRITTAGVLTQVNNLPTVSTRSLPDYYRYRLPLMPLPTGGAGSAGGGAGP